MIKIEGIVVFDNSPTPAGEDLMRMVHEGMDMGCWHKWKKYIDTRQAIGEWSICEYCGVVFGIDRTNPSYLTSLDDWRKVWDKVDTMSKDFHIDYSDSLFTVRRMSLPYAVFPWQTHPHHHLQALASVLTVECEAINNGIPCDGGELHKMAGLPCPSCSGKGTRTVLEVWRDKWQTEVKR
jgi:hypothetical protein